MFTEKARRTASIVAALPCACCFLSRIDFEDACRDYPEAAALAQRIGRDRFQAVWARMEAVERFEMMDEDGNSLVSKDEVREFLNFMKVRDVDEGDIDEIFAKMDTDGNGSVDLKEFLEFSQIKLPGKNEGARKDVYSNLFALPEKDKAKDT